MMRVGVMAVRPSTKRRRPEEETCVNVNQRGKKQKIIICDEKMKMGEKMRVECRNILDDLIEHSKGWAFTEPPEVKIPRDLATVKRKLDRNIYFGAKEFVDDVRLSFQNAKPYSPRWAAVLDAIFMRRWKLLLDARFNHHHHSGGSSNGEDSNKVEQVIKGTKAAEKEVIDHVLEEKKALRAAMLKTRFADTISKATQILHGVGGENKSADPSLRKRNELKMRRERQRKALEEIEKTADVDNTGAMLKMLFGLGYPTSKTMDRLGLHIKKEEAEADVI